MTVTGHEDEFRRLFEQEAGARLTTLAERAMELEARREDPELVTEMFRAAHTLKGGAAVVGFDNVAGVVHQLEQLLEELRSGERRPDGALIDGVLAAVDAVREMVACAMTGADASGAASAALAGIDAARGERPSSPDGTGSPATRAPEETPDAAESFPHAAREAGAPAPPRADADDDTAGAKGAGDGAGEWRAGEGGPEERRAGEGTRVERRTGEEERRTREDERRAGEPERRAGEEAPGQGSPGGQAADGASRGPQQEELAPPELARLPARRAAGPGFAPPPSPAARYTADAIAVPVARLDELVRLVGESAGALLRVGRLLTERLGDDPAVVDEYRELARVLHELQERTMRARMVSVGTVAGPLRRAVRDIARASGKRVRWELDGEDTELDRHVLEQLREPLVALVRNAADHGVEPPGERTERGKPEEAVVRVQAGQVGADVVIAVSDDGRGIDVGRVSASAGRRLSERDALGAIFEPGLSTAERVSGVSGRGVGLDAVRSAVDDLRGRVEVRTRPGRGTEFQIRVPMTLAVVRCLLVRVGGDRHALPMHSTATALPAPADAVISAEGRRTLLADGEAIGFADLATILGTPRPAGRGRRTAVVLTTAAGRYAFGVDELVGQRDVVVKDLGRFLPRLPLVAGASVEPDGGIMLVLDPDGLVAAARAAPQLEPPDAPEPTAPPTARLLVVDDALTVRELQRSILVRAGYEVETAADGPAALLALGERPADLVLTDVEMPGMDGYALTRAIRDLPELASVPVIILTSRGREDDRRRGLEAGADAYLVKQDFDASALLGAVRRLLGEWE